MAGGKSTFLARASVSHLKIEIGLVILFIFFLFLYRRAFGSVKILRSRELHREAQNVKEMPRACPSTLDGLDAAECVQR